MKPTDLDLPPKFGDWRRSQLDAVTAAISSGHRFTLLAIPTGIGKSLIYMALAKLLDTRALILTGTKGLQAQLMNDFASAGLKEIKGANNYRCVALDQGGLFDGFGSTGAGCDDGPCRSGLECGLRAGGCHYYDAIRVAAKAPMVVTNYKYWMTANRYAEPGALGEFGLLVLDEAHAAPDELSDFVSVELNRDETEDLLDVSLPSIHTTQEAWVDWSVAALEICGNRIDSAKRRLHEGKRYVRLVRRLFDLRSKLDQLAKSARGWERSEQPDPEAWVPGRATDWIPEETDGGIRFSPVWAHAYAERYLFAGIPQVALVSATLRPMTAKYLGLDGQYEFAEFRSTFPLRRRPVYYIPTTTVDRKMNEGQIRIWINRIDAIIAGRLDRKGIIHARSYDRMQLIKKRSRFSHLMLTHRSRTTRDVVDQFKRSVPPCVLVSPSVSEGYDFPYDQCEYQIIAKVPFIDTRSPVIQARAKSDKRYLDYLTALELVQQSGRGMRAEDDQCETFIIDDHIGWFRARNKDLIPKWWLGAYQIVNAVPPAPPKIAR